MNTKIAAACVIYNPPENLISNIGSYAGIVSLLIVVDNSENPDGLLHATLQRFTNVKIISYHENRGIAAALNDAVKLATETNMDWILTMDQDSCFDPEMANRYISAFEQLPGKDKIGAIGPEFEFGKHQPANSSLIPVTSLITSGSLVNIKVINEVGGYNEKLFIDEVDHEFCYRAGLKGYGIFQLPGIFMKHALGNATAVRTPGSRKQIFKPLHSPVRLYYMVRNACYMNATYKDSFPAASRLRREDVLVRIKNNLLYGRNRMAILKYIIRGYLDYKRNRFGKFQ